MGVAADQRGEQPQHKAPSASSGSGGGKRKKSKAASVVSGSISGALVSACVQPLDVIRTRMQADMGQGVLRGTFATMNTILKEGGVRTLWKGTQPTVIRLGLGAGLHFFFLETIKPLFETRQADGSVGLSAMGAMITGGMSRTLAAVAACPVTIVKTRMEYSGTGAHAYRSTLHALGEIWRAEGLRGMYRGIGPTALSQAPFSALYYLFYTRLQDKLKSGDRPSMGVNFVSGTLAAVAATVITQPADVIRTRMQLNLATAGAVGAAGRAGAAAAAAAAVAGAAAQPQGSVAIFRQIVGEHGLRGLLSGAAPRVVKRTLQTALLWTVYEELYPALSKAGEALQASMAAAASPPRGGDAASRSRRDGDRGGGDCAAA